MSSVRASLSIPASETRTSRASQVPTIQDANLPAPCRWRRPHSESGLRATGPPWAGNLALPSPPHSRPASPHPTRQGQRGAAQPARQTRASGEGWGLGSPAHGGAMRPGRAGVLPMPLHLPALPGSQPSTQGPHPGPLPRALSFASGPALPGLSLAAANTRVLRFHASAPAQLGWSRRARSFTRKHRPGPPALAPCRAPGTLQALPRLPAAPPVTASPARLLRDSLADHVGLRSSPPAVWFSRCAMGVAVPVGRHLKTP